MGDDGTVPNQRDEPTADASLAVGSRRAWLIWLVALSVYALAVFHRSSLGVAGLIAADRFQIEATQLAVFTMLQLLVYAGMQVPVGVLLDRYGSRAMLLGGLALMTVAQLGFAFADTFPAALVARALLGAGDAMIFVSVIRLVSAWFLVRQAPFVTQLTGQTGQLGAIAAAAPLSLLLRDLGWTRAFALTSTVGVVLLVAVAALVKDSPYERAAPVRLKMRALTSSVRLVWGNPGTRLGMWSHFTSQFAANVFAMLWGFPFLVSGQGLSPTLASSLLMLMVAWVVVSGLALSWFTARFPYWRSWLIVAIAVAIAGSWGAVLVRDEPSPLWLLVVLVLVTATGGPASMIGFDLARTFTPLESSGRANGMVNAGGFFGALLAIGAIGIILDLREPGGVSSYELDDFRAAMSVQFVGWAVGIAQVLRYRRKGLEHLRRVHPGAIEDLKAGRPFAHPGFNDREGI